MLQRLALVYKVWKNIIPGSYEILKFHRRVFVLFFKMIAEEHLGLPIISG